MEIRQMEADKQARHLRDYLHITGFTIDDNEMGITMDWPGSLKKNWEQAGRGLGKFLNIRLFLIGDFLIEGIKAGYIEEKNLFTEAQTITGLTEKTLKTAVALAKGIKPEIRRTDLSPDHHAAVIGLEPELQRKFLEQAVYWKWTARELKKRVQSA
jgi:hypothetical protein